VGARLGRRILRDPEIVKNKPKEIPKVKKKIYNLEENYNMNKEMLYDVFLAFVEKIRDITMESELGDIKVFSKFGPDSITFSENASKLIENKIKYIAKLFNLKFDDIVLEVLGRNDYAQITAYSFENTDTLSVIKHHFKN